MVEIVTIEAALRERAGKGAARATRRAGKIPGVIYGAKEPPRLIAVEPRDILREINRHGWRSRLYEVKVGETSERALLRDVQFHPVTDRPEHVDFQRLAPGQEVRFAVEVVFLNEASCPGLKAGGVLNVVRHEVEVYCTPENVPERFEVDLAGLAIGDTIHWSAIKAPPGVRPVIADRDFTIATIAPPTKGAEAAPAAAEAAAPAAAPAKGAAPAKAAQPAAGKAAAPAKAPAKK
ncbi:MAG: 50S ribosomal protein L25/general stress protein Ctc [Acetobacteraceae bacterium]|nr:50S ribosomal protein L25/general stress protein Ctc [Acetobacteraceae bacterium]